MPKPMFKGFLHYPSYRVVEIVPVDDAFCSGEGFQCPLLGSAFEGQWMAAKRICKIDNGTTAYYPERPRRTQSCLDDSSDRRRGGRTKEAIARIKAIIARVKAEME